MKDFKKLLHLNLQSVKTFIKGIFTMYIILFILIVLQRFSSSGNVSIEYNFVLLYKLFVYPTIFFLPLIKFDERFLLIFPISGLKTYPIIHFAIYTGLILLMFIPIYISHLLFGNIINLEILKDIMVPLVNWAFILVLIKNANRNFKNMIGFFKKNILLFIFPLIVFSINLINGISRTSVFKQLDFSLALFISLLIRVISINSIKDYEEVYLKDMDKNPKITESYVGNKDYSQIKILFWTRFLAFKNNYFLDLFLLLPLTIFFFYIVLIGKSIFYIVFAFPLILILFSSINEQKFLLALPFDFYKVSKKLRLINIIFALVLLGLIFIRQSIILGIDSVFTKNFLFLIASFIIFLAIFNCTHFMPSVRKYYFLPWFFIAIRSLRTSAININYSYTTLIILNIISIFIYFLSAYYFSKREPDFGNI
ncbi:MAG: hypothetical protein ACTHWZ_07325 [Peptoniphilaceae bacterium]